MSGSVNYCLRVSAGYLPFYSHVDYSWHLR